MSRRFNSALEIDAEEAIEGLNKLAGEIEIEREKEATERA
jgi:hypothetical protein